MTFDRMDGLGSGRWVQRLRGWVWKEGHWC
jgi:hypothetical protein